MTSKVIEVGYGKIKRVKIGGGDNSVPIGGLCAIENRDHALMMAERLGKIYYEQVWIEFVRLIRIKIGSLPLVAFMVAELQTGPKTFRILKLSLSLHLIRV